ncbi:MAG: translation initiation factor IF-2 [Thermodesulfovibrionia bacterium]|nr:translation initiation factor IF-2 [Thermodesulfovibrionia bacterium]
MAKKRVHELSKETGVSNKEILAKLNELGIEAKSHASSIDEDIALKIIQFFNKKGGEKTEAETASKVQNKTTAEKQKTKPSKPDDKVKKENKSVAPAKAKKAEGKPKDKEEQKREETAKPSFVKKAEETEAVSIKPASTENAAKIEKARDNKSKFQNKPGMMKAFDSIRRVEAGNKGFAFQAHHKKTEKKPLVKSVDTIAPPLSTQPRKRILKFREGTTVKEFAELIGQKLQDVIKKFMELGYMATINQALDADAAQIVAETYDIKIEPTKVESEEEFLQLAAVDESALMHRPPIVTIMGHVDHGKTTLLDTIRKTKVTESESGGITQHIGAYKITVKGKEIVFLDTPGHEAFTMMRARGAKVTDIVVLVVAADDGVMPQTIEAINHAKAAKVPIIVAVNKIDKPEADVSRVRNELSQYNVVSEAWGGENIFVEVSAKKGTGIDTLLEMILLQAEVLELKADYKRAARGTVIEAKLDKGRGPIATVLIESGTLKTGDSYLVGTIAGRVRALLDDNGKKIDTAGPSTPVEVIGLPDIPQTGDVFVVLEDERRARQIAVTRLQKQRTVAAPMKKVTLDEFFEKVKEGEIRDLNIIIKADVQGSVEAVKDSLENLSTSDVQVKVIHTGAGGINESDIMLASASNAIIVGFNVRPDAKAASLAEREGVDIELYSVIYEAINDVRKALEGLLAPTFNEKVLGRAEVRGVFKASKVGSIAGCYVIDGMMSRASSGVRVIRDSVVVYESKIASLKRFKEDVREVQTGFECGILVDNFNDIKVGDILENYIIEKVATKLSD